MKIFTEAKLKNLLLTQMDFSFIISHWSPTDPLHTPHTNVMIKLSDVNGQW